MDDTAMYKLLWSTLCVVAGADHQEGLVMGETRATLQRACYAMEGAISNPRADLPIGQLEEIRDFLFQSFDALNQRLNATNR